MPGKRIRPFLAVLIAALFAGCAARDPKPVNLSGFPPAFQQGYADGCGSAGKRALRRDERRYKADAQYMQGWNDGYNACGGR